MKRKDVHEASALHFVVLTTQLGGVITVFSYVFTIIITNVNDSRFGPVSCDIFGQQCVFIVSVGIKERFKCLGVVRQECCWSVS